jgi:hypothetical protein
MRNKDIDRINKWLDETYGHDLLGRPNWRIIFSTGEMEKRKGMFAEFYGHIFVREYYGVKEQPKYLYHPYWREKWILERLDFTPNPELALDVAGHYEPIYVFYDENGNYLKPTMKAVQWYMTKLLMRRPWKTRAEKEREIEEMERGEYDEEVAHFYGCLEERFGGELAAAIRHGEAVVNPGLLYDADGKEHWFNRSSNGSDNRKPAAVPVQGQQASTVSG